MTASRDEAIGPCAFGVEQFTVPAVLDRRADQFCDRVMMSIAGRAVTFGQMRDRSCAAANVLAEHGVKQGDIVALFTGTCPEWVYFWLGAARIGAVTAALNGASKGDFLSHVLRLSQARIVLTDLERHPRLIEVAGDVEKLESTLVRGDSLAEALEAASVDAPCAVPAEPGDIGALFFTSGTTGPSKAVATTWHYLFQAAATVASAWEFGSGDVLWNAMPLFHLSAAPTVLAPMLVGGTSVLAAGFHPTSVWDQVRDCGAVGFAGAGAMVSILWDLPPDPLDAELPLRFLSAAPISADVYREIERRYDCRIVTMYGLTEAFPIAYKSLSDEGIPGTSGRINQAFDVRIIDPQGSPLSPGEVGEIACRARTTHAMSEGYVSSASGGAGLRVDPHPEWFRTGDLGVVDGDANLTYVDRVKDSVRRRGENVSSVEVEQTVMRHPAVLEAAALGVPSELGEDDILVVVTLAPDAHIEYPQLLDFCSARMPYFWVPRYLEVLDEMPKNVIGRVRKDVLRSRGLGANAWDREAHGYVLSRLNGRTRMTMTYQQQFVLDGLAGRESILDLTARYNRAYSGGDLLGWITTFRHSGATYTRAGETFTDLRAAFDGGTGARLVAVDHEIAVDGVDATQRCVALVFRDSGLQATGTFTDRLIYERGGWYFTSRDLEWDVVPRDSALPV